jgi:GNAT superfamily N-acetyltransferase
MLTYTFKAKNNEGVLVSGNMAADRREAVVSALKQKGYFLLSVKQQSKLSTILRLEAGLGSRVSVRDRAIFTHQLATLLRAGMQLCIALKTLTKQTENKYLASVIRQLHRDIEQSSSLSQAMAKHPRAFSQVYTAIVEAAEESGSLAETLSVLSKQLKTQAAWEVECLLLKIFEYGDYSFHSALLGEYSQTLNCTFFLAKHKGNIVGAAGCLYSHMNPAVVIIGPVGVAAEYRRNGIGRKLVTSIVEHLRGRPCSHTRFSFSLKFDCGTVSHASSCHYQAYSKSSVNKISLPTVVNTVLSRISLPCLRTDRTGRSKCSKCTTIFSTRSRSGGIILINPPCSSSATRTNKLIGPKLVGISVSRITAPARDHT